MYHVLSLVDFDFCVSEFNLRFDYLRKIVHKSTGTKLSFSITLFEETCHSSRRTIIQIYFPLTGGTPDLDSYYFTITSSNIILSFQDERKNRMNIRTKEWS